jgi:hypothetical protein
MKTTILKWDYRLQLVLGIINLLGFVAFWYAAYIVLFFEVFIGAYQLISNGTNILLQHKSIGFTEWRKAHLICAILYVAFLIPMALYGIDSFDTFLFAVLFLIMPQTFLYSYIVLCKKELDFIEQREFHILK